MGRHRVQVYFKDRIESASNISIEEFTKLVEFRQRLETRGILYKSFKDDDQLRQEIRVNIQRPILEYLKRVESSGSTKLCPSMTPPLSELNRPRQMRQMNLASLIKPKKQREQLSQAASSSIGSTNLSMKLPPN
jgi:putative ubiquitin-RnfH superfamily antitoxin RatB of RatAB toxin-antitoxin module